jgi:hypothetical protein
MQLASAKFKCHTHVPSACIDGTIPTTRTCGAAQTILLTWKRKEATSSAGSAQSNAPPP